MNFIRYIVINQSCKLFNYAVFKYIIMEILISEKNKMQQFLNSLIEVEKDGYLISTDRKKLDIDVIHSFLSERSYWSQGITPDRVIRSIENSLSFGLYTGGKQIGFARVVSDYTRFAYLADVFVLEEHRGRGLSKWLLSVILSFEEIKVNKWMLGTKDAHSLYEGFGFTSPQYPERLMEKILKA